MLKISSVLRQAAPLLLSVLPIEIQTDSNHLPTVLINPIEQSLSISGKQSLAIQKQTPYSFVNQGHKQIKTILMGVDLNSDGKFYDLQENFLKEFCHRNTNAKVVLLYDPRIDLNILKDTVKKIGASNNVQFVATQEGQSYRWVQDPIVFLKDSINNKNIALSNTNGAIAETLLKSKIISDVVVPANENILIDGGDLRALEVPDGPVLIVGLTRRLMKGSKTPESIVLTLNEYISEFGRYGFQPHNILFRGGNSEGVTFEQAFQKMSQKEFNSLHPQILIKKKEEVPMGQAIGYHTDLAMFETGIRNEKGKPILMMSKPLILYDDYFQNSITNMKGEEEAIRQLQQSQKWWKNLYEKEYNQYTNMGFAIRTLPFGEILNSKGTNSIVNYTNVIADKVTNGKIEIYLPVQGENHYLDAKAIKAYQEVYGNLAEIIPIVGSQQMSPEGGLLNCLFNVIERR